MSAYLSVIEPGLSTTVQDEGRAGMQRFGIPVSGALDRVALAAANIVAGNAIGTAGLECLYRGPTLEVTGNGVRIAVAGSGAVIEIMSDQPTTRIPPLTSATLASGQRFRVVQRGPSISAYLAVSGGIAVPEVLHSRSTYLRARLGGIDGRALQPGDIIPLAPTASTGPEQNLSGIDLTPADAVHIVLGPQADRFTSRAHAVLSEATYTVMPASDRMGLRLDGPRLEHTAGADIVSDAIPPGAIQVPGDGCPIVMLADRQTTGGYTKIATVCSADIPALGRVGPGATLRFRVVTVEAAQDRRRALDRTMAAWPARLAPASAATDITLLSANLVSGVIDAAGGSEPD